MALNFRLSPDGRIREESEQGQRGTKGRIKGEEETGCIWPLLGQFISVFVYYIVFIHYTPLVRLFMSSC